VIAATGVQAASNDNRTLGQMDLVAALEGGAESSQPHGFVAGSDVLSARNPARSRLPQRRRRAGATAFLWRRQAAIVQ